MFSGRLYLSNGELNRFSRICTPGSSGDAVRTLVLVMLYIH